MLGPAEFRELVSGRRRGPGAALLRGGLRLAEVPYTLGMRARNAAYDHGWFRTRRAAVPVISVGNLSVGGTGKTPLVEWLARWWLARGIRPGVVSRGYKAASSGPNDEALELAERVPGLAHLQHRDRVAGVEQVVARHGCEVVILDDAFQHRRIGRDLDVVLLDALEPFGWEHLLPRGTLRELPSSLARAQVIALSRADAISADQREAIRVRVQRLAPAADWLELVYAPQRLLAGDGRQQPLDQLAGRRVAAFCGIGNPDGFRHTLAGLPCQLVGFRSFPDHHAYASADLENLANWLDRLGAVDVVLCTHKDLVKLREAVFAGRDLWAVQADLEIAVGSENLERRLQTLGKRTKITYPQ